MRSVQKNLDSMIRHSGWGRAWGRKNVENAQLGGVRYKEVGVGLCSEYNIGYGRGVFPGFICFFFNLRRLNIVITILENSMVL